MRDKDFPACVDSILIIPLLLESTFKLILSFLLRKERFLNEEEMRR
jgi:hypothetical protein